MPVTSVSDRIYDFDMNRLAYREWVHMGQYTTIDFTPVTTLGTWTNSQLRWFSSNDRVPDHSATASLVIGAAGENVPVVLSGIQALWLYVEVITAEGSDMLIDIPYTLKDEPAS